MGSSNPNAPLTTCSSNPFEDRSWSNHLNVTELEERVNRTIAATTNTNVESYLKKLGISPTQVINEATEWIAIIYFVVKIIKIIKQGIEFMVTFVKDIRAKKKSEKNEVSLRQRSIKLSIKSKTAANVGIFPAADYLLVDRNPKKRKVEVKPKIYDEDQAHRGIVVAIGAGAFLPSEQKYSPYEFEVNDKVFLNSDGIKIYDDLSKAWYWLYHVKNVIAAIKED